MDCMKLPTKPFWQDRFIKPAVSSENICCALTTFDTEEHEQIWIIYLLNNNNNNIVITRGEDVF